MNALSSFFLGNKRLPHTQMQMKNIHIMCFADRSFLGMSLLNSVVLDDVFVGPKAFYWMICYLVDHSRGKRNICETAFVESGWLTLVRKNVIYLFFSNSCLQKATIEFTEKDLYWVKCEFS